MATTRAAGGPARGGDGTGSQTSRVSAIPTVPGRKTLLEFVKETGTKLTIDGEELYRVEGDLLLDIDQLETWANLREALARASQAGAVGAGGVLTRELVGILRDGKVLRWKDGLELTYCVLKGTFTSTARYNTVRENMEKATNDWEQTCGIAFRHLQNLDNSPGTNNPGAVFTVRGFDSGGQFIAAAFFPDDPLSRRRMLIDHSYFSTSFDRVGVLRHELGHVLGFRHEHIRPEAPPACPNEDLFGTTPLSAYDPQSVMHYFCGGVGSSALAITDTDRTASQRVYGGPLSSFSFAE